MLNELGLGGSNTENKSNDSNDTVNDQDNDMNTGQVSVINLNAVKNEPIEGCVYNV